MNNNNFVQPLPLGNNTLLRSCFNNWRRKVKIKHVKKENAKLKVEQGEKLDKLMKTLEQYKEEKMLEERRGVITPLQIKQKSANLGNYKNRFEAQKTTIEKLSMKLEQRDKLIEDLKLGVFNRHSVKSINETKIEIREIFASCSAKVRCKIAVPPDCSDKFMIFSQKAPKIIQEMEERALTRANRRELILERKRIIDENKKRIIAEAIENKRVQDEEEKRRNLETIKERRRKELERDKIRQTNKLIFLEKLNRANDLHNRNLLKKGFKLFMQNYTQSKNNYDISEKHYKLSLLNKSMTAWKILVEDLYRDKNALADAFFAEKILSRVLKVWCELRFERIRSMQVAEDFYDLLLVNNVFVHWHRYVCIQYMSRQAKMKTAQNHYNKKIIFHCFYQWRSLPAVIQLEKSKEEKKKKWRQKVWEILPDYEPPLDTFI